LLNAQNFKLSFIRQEQHLMLPTVNSIVVTQTLYDTLFQYLITPEKEELLKKFIKMMEDHIKSKDLAPFSQPISALEFLDEGLEEFRLLSWIEIPVTVWEINLDESISEDVYQDELERVLNMLESLMIFSRPDKGNILWVYPYNLVR